MKKKTKQRRLHFLALFSWSSEIRETVKLQLDDHEIMVRYPQNYRREIMKLQSRGETLCGWAFAWQQNRRQAAAILRPLPSCSSDQSIVFFLCGQFLILFRQK